jgi:hypothetical protein
VLLTNKPKNEVDSDFSSLDDVETLYEEAYDLYEQGDLDTSSEILERILDSMTKLRGACINGIDILSIRIFPKSGRILQESH